MKSCLCILICFLWIACSDRAPDKKRNLVRTGFEVKVKHSTGDPFEKQIDTVKYKFLPYIGNVARLKNFDQCQLEFLILAQHIRRNHDLIVVPIGILEFSEMGVKQKVIISVPENVDIRSISVDNYEEFVLKFFGVQQIIENWYHHRLGFGMVRDIRWDNELSAIRNIEACMQN